ncbi:class I SAM-dependent methyltransferase, partial [Heyndrickxia sporothermodurans]
MKQVFYKLKRRLRIISFTDSIYDFCCDVLYGIETRKTDLLLDNRQVHFDYMPTSYLIIKRLFKKYKFQPQDHLVDFGCGKGRVVLVAAKYSCPIITGVEINPSMFKVAEKNVRNSFKRKNINAAIYLKMEDASKMKISNDMNKFFFFNPFHLKIFISTINQITKSVQEHPRKILLFFLWPQESTLKFMENLEEYIEVETYDDGKYKYSVYE